MPREVNILIKVGNLTDEQVKAVMIDCERLMKKHDRKTGVIGSILKKVKPINDSLAHNGKLVSYGTGFEEANADVADTLIRIEVGNHL